ncbi:MAG: S8 family serine peptidase [Planctomycetota bacterium]
MSINDTNRSDTRRATRDEGRTRRNERSLALTLCLCAFATSCLCPLILMAGQSSRQKDADGPGERGSRPLPERKLSYIPGEVIVKLRDGRTDSQRLLSLPSASDDEIALLRLQAAYGLSEKKPASRRMRSRFHLLGTDRNVSSVCAELRNDPDVEYAQPNYIYQRCGDPNDPEFADQYAHQLIEMSDAWDISTGSRDIVVAVLDTGVDVNHPDLKDNIWINEGEIANNEIDDDENGFVDDVSGWNFEDDSNDVIPDDSWSYVAGHGTQVSGVIAGVGNNGIGVCGVNWQGSIMALRLSTEITSAEVAAGLDYATANGAHVVNMSFASDEFGPEGDPAVKAAIDNAYAQGVLLVASAGNDDTTEPHYPAAYYNVMAVSSTNGEDIKTGHSSFGHWVDIAAPGTDIVTTDLGDEYIATAGTSFSGPYVAAVGALVLAHDPNLMHVEVRAILENTTDPVYYGDLDPDMGYVGTGRVNAYSALLDADQRFPLGEIVEPMPHQSFAADGNDVCVTLFVHGDSYLLEYSTYGQDDWMVLSDGSSPVDPNGFVRLSFPAQPLGAFELRLSVTTNGYTHTDRKTFGFEYSADLSPWPLPEMPENWDELPDEMYIGSPLCLDVDGDGRNEIVQASMSWGDFWPEGTITIWEDDGTSLEGWPRVLGGEDYWDSLTASGMAVGDIDGDGDYEIVVVDDWSVMATALHVETGEVVEGDWPVEVGGYWYAYIMGSPILADLDGDGDSEIIVALDEESRESDGLFAIQGDGTFFWQRRYTTEGPMSVADFDGDGDVEIALCGYGPGITRVYTFVLDHNGQQIERWRGGSKKGTAIADLDADGEQELIFCTDDSVKAVHIDGKTVWTARVRDPDPFDVDGGLSVGDIDGDGLSEVYVSSYMEADGFAYTLVHAFDHEGKDLSDAGYPKTVMGYPRNCTPLIGDIDGDGQKELLVASAGAPVMAWESDGSATPGFPLLNLSADIGSTPALEDLDKDGDIEMMVNGYDYQFHVLDLPGSYDPVTTDWGMARRDAQNSGWTAPAPSLDPIAAPAEVEPGRIIEFPVTTTNPADRPTHLTVGNLPEGAYFDPNAQTVVWKPAADQAPNSYTFSFLVTDGIRQHSRSASIAVLQNAIYWADIDTDPNWVLDEGWAWGTPAGAGSWNGDPDSGYTGENVIGYELEGDYADNMAETLYATTPAINCEGYQNIRLSFKRWLGVESPYDYADIEVSNDGVNWAVLWATGLSHVSDNTWQSVDYAVPSSVADGQPTVYFRWGIGPTDDSITYAGWNIDDVRVTGDLIQ